MGTFMNGMSGSMIASFINLQMSMRTFFQPSDALAATINSNNAAIKALDIEIAALDVTILNTTDSVQLGVLTTQRAQKDSLGEALLIASEQSSTQYTATVNNAVSSIATQVNALTATNIGESNLKSVFNAYLQSIPVSAAWDNNTRQQVKSIAEQCPSEGGIGVYTARALYQILVGYDLNITTCSGEERNDVETSGMDDNIRVFPNPTNGIVNVTLPEKYTNQNAVFIVHSSVGKQVLETEYKISNAPVRLDLSKQPKGAYFIMIRINGVDIKTVPIVIQ
jgi:hypothetical protein